MSKLLASLRTLTPTQYVAVAVVLPITFFGALALVWAFRKWNHTHAK